MAESTVVTRVVHALVGGGLVPADKRAEAERLVATAMGVEEVSRPRARAKLGETAGYVGAALVVAAGALFITEQWSNLTQGERVAWIGGMSILLGAVGLVTSFVGTGFVGMREEAGAVRRRLAGTIFVGMAATAGVAAGLQTDRMTTGNETWPMAAAFGTVAVFGALGYWVAPTAVGQIPIAVGTFGVIPALLEVFVSGDQSFVTALALLEIALAVLWWGATESDLVKPREVGLLATFVIAMFGAQMPVMNQEAVNLGYLLTALVAVAAFGGYILRPAWPYLGAGVVAVTIVVPEAINDWTEGSIGPAGAVLLAGVALLAASLASFRLHSESHRGQKPRRTRHFHRPHPSGT